MVGGELWELVAARPAAAGLRAISVDRRGCGRSDRPGAGFDFDTLADDLAELLRELDLRDVTLVAHSVGGAEAVRMLARHGAMRIARPVLVASTTPGPPPWLAPDAAALDELVRGMLDDRPGYVRAGVPGFFGDAGVTAPIDLTGRPTAQALPDGRLEVYPGGPHGLPLTHPGRVADDILAFVPAEVRARAA